MSSVHFDKGAERKMFGLFTRKAIKKEIFDAVVKINPAYAEGLKEKDCGLPPFKK